MSFSNKIFQKAINASVAIINDRNRHCSIGGIAIKIGSVITNLLSNFW